MVSEQTIRSSAVKLAGWWSALYLPRLSESRNIQSLGTKMGIITERVDPYEIVPLCIAIGVVLKRSVALVRMMVPALQFRQTGLLQVSYISTVRADDGALPHIED
jgi:hypothetical protein